ncbi:hypothetical protein C1645_759258 [Glomus cerebriforme]|uniref:BTB domain-containing protein n=1 Tax=Glomus cerebriforme TaxID=658196 RepID=A0A397T952_9GLOM|nr:hypothetical protein C1645_759258 [Glomus cerebriforme]
MKQIYQFTKMLTYHFPEISSDSIPLPVTDHLHDTIIEINDSKSGNIKIFNAHSSVLCKRCEYFKVALSEKWAKKVDDKFKLRLDDLPDAFEMVLKGIHSGTIVLENLNTNILMELMLISDILLLQDFFNFLRSKLDEKKDKTSQEWNDNDIISILKISYRIPSIQDLYLYCQDVLVEKPSILFESPIFLTIDEELLLRILRLDMICLPEITIFNKLIEWGIANTPSFNALTDKTSQIDALGVTLENALQLIRYVNINREEILEYKQILPKRRIQYQLPPRINSSEEPKIIGSRFAGIIASWIDRKETPYTESSNPFLFRNVFKMNDRTDFYQEHQKYYNKSSGRTLPTMRCHHGGPSLMIMKLKGSNKIIGAYVPIDWKQDIAKKVHVTTTESFMFSSDDKYGTNYRLSRIQDFEHAICLEEVKPSGVLLKFGEDLIFDYYLKYYVRCHIKKGFYEQPTILNEGTYNIEKWEIFKLCRKDNRPMIVVNDEVIQTTPPQNPPVETKIIDNDFFGLIATWIDRNEPMKYTGSNMPFQFTPLFRMNDDNFSYQHDKYYNQSTDGLLPTMKCHHGPSLMIMKTSNKIIGAYNPINWKHESYIDEYEQYETTSESFIFSSNDIHGTNHRISRVKNFYHAVCSGKIYSRGYSNVIAPNGVLLKFGRDLEFYYDDGFRGENPSIYCKIRENDSYEQPPIVAAGEYKINEWEIFRVTRKENQIQSRVVMPDIRKFTTKNRLQTNKYVNKRKIPTHKIIDDNFSPSFYQIIDDNFFALIATWIDGAEDSTYSFNTMPFQFTLLFRMKERTSTHSNYYNQSTYHLLPTMKCHHGPSLMVMRIKDSNKIIGAYNPINWKRDLTANNKNQYVRTSESFIFSRSDEGGTRLSRVKNFDKAMSQSKVYPNGILLKFGEDLSFAYVHGNLHTDEPYWEDEENLSYDIIWPFVMCDVKENGYYEQPSILPKGRYEIDRWEIYRVTKIE